jgi:SMC interacting uncharacterized protein involved in chromosome segregation
MSLIERKEPWWSIQLHGSTDETLRDMYADGRITLAEYEAEVDRRLGVARQLAGAVSETERLRHEVQARDDVIYHAAEHLRRALDAIAAYEDRITDVGGQ